MSVESARELVDQYESYFNKGQAVVEGLDKTNSQDRLLALEIALRGKTMQEYFDIVKELMQTSYKAKDKKDAASHME